MRTRNVERAARKGQWLRAAIGGGPSGGKTFTALLLASVLDDGGGTTVIDTEVAGPDSWSSGLYAGQFGEFEWGIWGWPAPYKPDELAEAIWSEAQRKSVIVVDSGTPFWHATGGILAHRDEAARVRFGNNSWAAWSEVRPIQENLIWTLQNAPAHILVCARAKIEWDTAGAKPTAVGTALKQDPELEHEMTLAFNVDRDRGHSLLIRKSRLHGLPNSTPGSEIAQEDQRAVFSEWRDWLAAAEPTEPRASLSQIEDVRSRLMAVTPEDVKQRVGELYVDRFGRTGLLKLSDYADALAWVSRPVGEILGQETPAVAPEPVEEKAPAKKATKPRKSRPAKPKPEPEEEPQADPAESEADEQPPEAEEITSSERQITDRFLGFKGPVVKAVREALEEAEFWPLGVVENDAQREEVLAIFDEIDKAEEAKA